MVIFSKPQSLFARNHFAISHSLDILVLRSGGGAPQLEVSGSRPFTGVRAARPVAAAGPRMDDIRVQNSPGARMIGLRSEANIRHDSVHYVRLPAADELCGR